MLCEIINAYYFKPLCFGKSSVTQQYITNTGGEGDRNQNLNLGLGLEQLGRGQYH